MDELIRFLTDQIVRLSPSRIALIATAGVAVKAIMSALKHLYPALVGNVVQTITFVVSFLVMLALFFTSGVFPPFPANEVFTWLLASVVVALTAIGTNEVLSNRNPPAASQTIDRERF